MVTGTSGIRRVPGCPGSSSALAKPASASSWRAVLPRGDDPPYPPAARYARQPHWRLAPTAISLALAGHAARGGRPGLQPAVGNELPAVHALAVAAVLNPRQRGHHLGALCPGGRDGGLVPVRLRQVGPGITRVQLAAPRTGMLALQHEDGPVEV